MINKSSTSHELVRIVLVVQVIATKVKSSSPGRWLSKCFSGGDGSSQLRIMLSKPSLVEVELGNKKLEI